MVALIVLGIVGWPGPHSPGQATSRSNDRFAQQLRAECHQLLESVVKRPYGWAWEADDAQVSGNRRDRIVAMGPGESPAAGVLLLWAGEFLDDPDLKEAARQVARARARVASTRTTSRILNRRRAR